jgi:hypothetical protein
VRVSRHPIRDRERPITGITGRGSCLGKRPRSAEWRRAWWGRRPRPALRMRVRLPPPPPCSGSQSVSLRFQGLSKEGVFSRVVGSVALSWRIGIFARCGRVPPPNPRFPPENSLLGLSFSSITPLCSGSSQTMPRKAVVCDMPESHAPFLCYIGDSRLFWRPTSAHTFVRPDKQRLVLRTHLNPCTRV